MKNGKSLDFESNFQLMLSDVQNYEFKRVCFNELFLFNSRIFGSSLHIVPMTTLFWND